MMTDVNPIVTRITTDASFEDLLNRLGLDANEIQQFITDSLPTSLCWLNISRTMWRHLSHICKISTRLSLMQRQYEGCTLILFK